MTETVLILVCLALATLLATVVQTLVGFAFALIMMPIVTLLLGVHSAAPLVALTGLTLYAWNTLRYRTALNPREVWPLAAAAVAGVPVGTWGVAHASEPFVKGLLGAILIGYSLYGLTRHAPLSCSPRWAYPAGFLAGCLGGAYNTPGPPLAVYGALRRWDKEEYRAGLQTLFLCSGTVTVVSHAFAHHLTAPILCLYASTPPALIAGLAIGGWLDRYVNKERFRALVMAMILLLGVSLTLNLGGR
jgi:uncharacterized protein